MVERQETHEVVKFRGVGIADEEIVHYKGERRAKAVEWVWWRKSMGVKVSEKPCWDRRATRRSWDKSLDWGRPGTVFRTSQKRKGRRSDGEKVEG